MNDPKVMLLIDADNVSLDVIEQSVAWVAKHHGGPHVRRAYCTAESAVKHQAAFKRLGIRPMVNLAAGKNSTDIALAVDAIDLATAERPQVMVIASSDSDFAPLVSRLREKGCRVVGLGQDGKTGDETRAVYDDYEVFTHGKAKAPAAPRKAAPRKAPARKAAAKPAPKAPVLPDKAAAILKALPSLASGETVELRVAAERLREAGLLSRSGSSTKLFAPLAEWFELLPPKTPNHVRLRA
jgi:predicted nucleic acid-binding protein